MSFAGRVKFLVRLLIIYETDMEYIVDIQGFKKPLNEFILKELAIISLGDDVPPRVFLFSPPSHWKLLPAKYRSENDWLRKNYLGISWNEGDIPYEDVGDILRSHLEGATKIHVKGLQKQKWIQNIIGKNVINVEDDGCPNLSKLTYGMSACTHHLSSYFLDAICAVRNAKAIKKWLIDFYNSPTYTMYRGRNNNSDDDSSNEIMSNDILNVKN